MTQEEGKTMTLLEIKEDLKRIGPDPSQKARFAELLRMKHELDGGIHAGYVDEQSERETRVTELKTLASILDRMLKAAKLAKAEWWTAPGNAAIERIYINRLNGKKAGFVEVVDGKFLLKENTTQVFVDIFRAARKEQKGVSV